MRLLHIPHLLHWQTYGKLCQKKEANAPADLLKNTICYKMKLNLTDTAKIEKFFGKASTKKRNAHKRERFPFLYAVPYISRRR